MCVGGSSRIAGIERWPIQIAKPGRLSRQVERVWKRIAPQGFACGDGFGKIIIVPFANQGRLHAEIQFLKSSGARIATPISPRWRSPTGTAIANVRLTHRRAVVGHRPGWCTENVADNGVIPCESLKAEAPSGVYSMEPVAEYCVLSRTAKEAVRNQVICDISFIKIEGVVRPVVRIDGKESIIV